MFQKNELKAEVVRQGLTLDELSNAIGINPASLSRKMSGVSDFYRGEIEKIVQVLHLSGDDVLRIFFAE